MTLLREHGADGSENGGGAALGAEEGSARGSSAHGSVPRFDLQVYGVRQTALRGQSGGSGSSLNPTGLGCKSHVSRVESFSTHLRDDLFSPLDVLSRCAPCATP